MKKIYSIMMLVAVAAMAFVSCQKNEIEGVEKETISGLTFVSEKPAFDDETKTEWNGTTIQWSKDDAIRIGYTCDEVWQNADGSATADEANGSKTAKLYASSKLAEAAASAKFSVPGDFKGTAAGTYEFYGVYPSGSCVNGTGFTYAPSVTVKIPAEQTPASDSFDSAADIMVAKSPSTYTGIPTDPISLEWTRLVAHGYFTLKELALIEGETLSSIKLTANAEADMVGNHYVYLDTYNVTKPNSNSAANVLTINAANLTADAEGNVTFWASFLPCTWTSVTVVVETDKATYTREIDLSSNQKTFAQNARNKLAIGMSNAERVETVSNVGELPFERDFSEMASSSELTELDGFKSIKKVYEANGALKFATGSADGVLETVDLNLSDKFNVVVTATGWTDDELELIVESGTQKYTIALTTYGNTSGAPTGEFVAYTMNFEPVGDAATVKFTAVGGKRCFIQSIKISSGHVVLPPVLAATVPAEISAEGGEGSFNYTLSNPVDGKSVTASTDATWITGLTATDGVVTYTVAENTVEESRSAVVTLSYEGAESVNVTITQAAKPAEGAVEETIIYSTEFNYPINGSSYNSSNEYLGTDKSGTSWGIVYGNWNASSCAQMRVYAAANFGSVYMKFDVKNATRVSYKAKVTNTGLKLNTYYSTESGSSWIKVDNAKSLTTNLDEYTFVISETGSYNNVRIKFEAAGTAPTSGNYQLTIDDVIIYGISSGSGGETPEPTLTERNLAFSPATATATMGEEFTEPTLSGVTDGVTYASSNTEVATVDASTGEVTLVAAGETTITASASANATHAAGEASYTLTVSAAQGGAVSTFVVKSDDIVSNSGYSNYSKQIDNRDWLITFGGNNKSVGTNSGNRTKCKLTNYEKYVVSPITTNSIASAFASTTKISNVSKISYGKLSGGSNHASTQIYVLYSADGDTFSQIPLTSGTQGAQINVNSGGAFEFATCSGYFAVVFVATNNSGAWRLDDVNLTFTYTE